MPERPRLWGRVSSVLRWWPEYLVLVLLCMAVQIPVGVLALETPLKYPTFTVAWSSDFDENAGPPPEAGWPAEVAARTEGWPSPTSISINSSWLRRTKDSYTHDDGPLKHGVYSADVDAWGWPCTAVSRATIGFWATIAYTRVGPGDMDNVANLHWGGLAINAILAVSLVALVCVLVIGVVRLGRRRKPVAGVQMLDEPRSRANRLFVEIAIVALVGSIASSALATTSLNRGRVPWAAVSNIRPWIDPIDGAMHMSDWPVRPDSRLKFPARPTNVTVDSIWTGFGLVLEGTAQTSDGEFRSTARRHGLPLATFVEGEWEFLPTRADGPDETPRVPFQQGTTEAALGSSGVQQSRVLWSGRVVYDEIQSGRVSRGPAWSGLLLNPLLAVIFLWPLVFGSPRLWIWWVARRRRLSGHCVTCNYDCVGLERCPECGRVVATG